MPTSGLTFSQNIRRWFWRYFVYPVFPYLYSIFGKRQLVRQLGHEEYRQRYHLGWVKPGIEFTDLVKELEKIGFANHFVAWKDQGQVFSLRKLENFDWQYHIRIFEDGEVCGHYEKTPESHPLDHFFERGELDRSDVFLAWIGSWLVKESPAAPANSGKTFFHK